MAGSNKQSATAALVQLAEQLGCRERLRELSACEAVGLAYSAHGILAAIEMVGGAMAFTVADQDAAIRLRHSLMQAVGDVRRRWVSHKRRQRAESAFAPLGPAFLLTAAAAELRAGSPGAPPLACTAARLTLIGLLDNPQNEFRRQQLPAKSSKVSVCICAS